MTKGTLRCKENKIKPSRSQLAFLHRSKIDEEISTTCVKFFFGNWRRERPWKSFTPLRRRGRRQGHEKEH